MTGSRDDDPAEGTTGDAPAGRPRPGDEPVPDREPDGEPDGDEEPDPASSRRARAVTVTSVVLALLLGLGVVAALRGGGPGDGLGPAAPTPTRSAPAVTEVDWRRMAHPLECGELPRRVLDVEVADVVRGDGPEAVVVLRCDAGAGSPPSAVYVYDRDSTRHTPLRPVATLLDTGEDVLLNGVDAEQGLVRGTGFGYSGPGIPRCCPDRHETITWSWTGSDFRRQSTPVDAAGTDPG